MAPNPAVPQQDYLASISDQVFHVDPRAQGFGLTEHAFLDGYANKFFMLAGESGVFISPREVPSQHIEYLNELGIPHPPASNRFTLPTGAQPTAQLVNDPVHREVLVPYMVTPDVEGTAETSGLRTLVSAATTSKMADKADFQEALGVIANDIRAHTGFDVVIPGRRFQAGNSALANSAYSEFSQDGTRDVVLVKPKSASALGIFIVRAESGPRRLTELLDEHFERDDEALLEPFVSHNHSPSMQGAVRRTGEEYKHLYFGRQITKIGLESISYDSSQIPFGPETVAVDPAEMERLVALHLAVGEWLIRGQGIAGVAGLDSVCTITAQGKVEDLRFTELNLHLPSSLAVYASIGKVFPAGFSGIAENMNVPLAPGEDPTDFMERNARLLIKEKQTYGLFPLNMSYDDKVDIIIFARDQANLKQLKRKMIGH